MEPRPTDSTREADSALLTEAAEQEPLDLPPQALRYVELMSEVPAVRHVLFAWDGAALRLWAVTENYDFEANDQIFARELVLYREWPDTEYDFHVLPLGGEALDYVAPTGFALAWSRDGTGRSA